MLYNARLETVPPPPPKKKLGRVTLKLPNDRECSSMMGYNLDNPELYTHEI